MLTEHNGSTRCLHVPEKKMCLCQPVKAENVTIGVLLIKYILFFYLQLQAQNQAVVDHSVTSGKSNGKKVSMLHLILILAVNT